MISIESNKLVESETSSSEVLRPFFRWVGGKQKLVNTLTEYLPDDISQRRYYEPFLGAGSLSLAISPKRAYLSDYNSQLINAYKVVKEHPSKFINLLVQYSSNLTRENYYQIRNAYNQAVGNDAILQAVRFVILIQTSFNGIYRVNRKGEYNVPFGRPHPHLPTPAHIWAINKKLKNAVIRSADYQVALKKVKKGDVVYLDPPYPSLEGTSSYFHHYTPLRFPSEDQIDLSKVAKKLSRTGALVMISNADTPEIRQLYKRWNIIEADVTRYVSCKTQKKKVKELLIKNY